MKGVDASTTSINLDTIQLSLFVGEHFLVTRSSAHSVSSHKVLGCLSLRYHMAHKIHRMTQSPKGDAEANERFRDLADLLLMRELATDLADAREACVEVFALRGTHAWRPDVDPPEAWKEPLVALAAELELPVGTLEEAAQTAQALIAKIEASGSQ